MNVCQVHNLTTQSNVVSRTYILDCNPVALARGRLSRGTIYDSQKMQKLVHGITLRSQHDNQPLFSNCPLHMHVIFFMEIPHSKRTKKNPLSGKPHIFTPDLSNLIKYVEDIATQIIYKDDCLIYSISALKVYDEHPRTEFTLSII